MKIALIVPGGVDRSGTHRVIPALLWLVERLARAHEVHIFALYQEPRPSRYQLLGATVHNVGRGHTGWRTLGAIMQEHWRSAFDIFHAFWAVPPGVLAACAGRLLRRPVLLHLAGGELVALDDIGYGGWRTLRDRFWVRVALVGATCISAASEPMRKDAAHLGYRTVRLPLGADRAAWPIRPPRARDPSQPARLLHVASLNRVKDQPTLLRAAARLAHGGVLFSLDVVGVDTLDGEIQRTAVSLGISDRVTFHGFLPQAELRPLVERADLLLLTSRHEAGPLVVLEAALAGVPTVGTAVGHIAEWGPEAAAVVPVADAEALARETAALLADDERRRQIAAAAQRRAIAEDADWTARQVLGIYAALSGSEASSKGRHEQARS